MPSTIPPVQLGSSYGALLLAAFVAVALWGITCMQTLIYFVHYSSDKPHLKFLVIWLWLLDTAHQILIVKGAYDALIVNFCNYSRISTIFPEFLWQTLFTSLVCVTSQTFFTYRIWRFVGSRRVFWVIMVPVCLFELAGTAAIIAFGVITPKTAAFVKPIPSSIYATTHAVAAVADIALATGMIVLLLKSQERALKGSRFIIQKLLILTINTGTWTALFAVLTFITILASKNTLIYVAAYFPLCPLYCNTVLANLNAREFLSMGSIAAESESLENTYRLGPVFASPRSTVRGQMAESRLAVHVEVNKSVKIEDDEPPLMGRGSKAASRK